MGHPFTDHSQFMASHEASGPLIGATQSWLTGTDALSINEAAREPI